MSQNAGRADCRTQLNRLYQYNAQHCRCDTCTRAMRDYKREYRARAQV